VAVKGATPQILTDSFTYTNVIDKEPAYAIVYVSPAGLTSVNGEMGKFKVSDAVVWGAEVLYNGRVIGTFSSGAPEWWTKGSPAQSRRTSHGQGGYAFPAPLD